MRKLRYLSVCSGIEAATMAWHPLGWEPVAFADIEEFPSAVLAHHYPAVPNLGDMSKFNQWPDHAIDLLVGGTPCQAFSVAGLREGLNDPRGNLALTFLALARRYRPRWVVWENVPGVHSSWSDEAHRAPAENSSGIIAEARRAAELLGLDGSALLGGDAFEEVDQSSDFDCFLAGLEELGYGWATRVLDAQYFGVAQRRRRVFVVAHLGARAPAAAVLFEPESLRGDPPPSRQSGQGIAPTISSRAQGGGGLGTYAELGGALIPDVVGALQHGAHGGGGSTARMPTPAESLPAISHCLNAGAMGRLDSETETLIPMPQGGFFDGPTHTLRGDGFDASEDGTGRGTPLITAYPERQMTSPHNRSNPLPGDPSPTLCKDSGPPMIAFDCKASGQNGFGCGSEITSTMRAMGHSESHQNGGGHLAVAEPFTLAIRGRGESHQLEHRRDGTANALLTPNGGRAGIGCGAVAVDTYNGKIDGDVCATMGTNGSPVNATGPQVMSGMSVRRLTPIECERLQGFPDNYTRIPWGGAAAEECPDGHRYRALGNSMAVPVMRWIGARIQRVDAILEKEAAEKSA
jgi:DNA (cytosine-5)-methyltransferase 1